MLRIMNSQTAPRTFSRLDRNVRQLVTFGAIGVVSTLAYVAIYAALRTAMPAVAANAAALLVTAVGNTAANRRLTFAVQGRDGLARDHAAGILALGAALAITTASVAVMDVFLPGHGRLFEIVVLVGANAAATVARFLLLRVAIDRGHAASPSSGVAGNLSRMNPMPR
jgi:putative flippase GtrA